MIGLRAGGWIAALGALCLAAGTVCAAIAAHVGTVPDSQRLHSAALMLLVHGLGLLWIAVARTVWPQRRRALTLIAFLISSGLLLFAGSLVLAVAFAFSTAAAPFGGGLLILGWLLAALVSVFSAPSPHTG